MNEAYFKKIITAVILVALIVLSFFIIQPVLISIIIALILAFIFAPVYDWLYKKTKMKNVSAFLIIIFLLLIIILPLWFLTPLLIRQSFAIFQATQQIDFIKPFQDLFPSLFTNPEFSGEIGSILSSFTSNAANTVVNSLSKIILNFPTISLHLVVVFFTFFYVLRDKEGLIEYVKGLLPFSKEVERKLFSYTKNITSSVIYGQIIIGIIQGVIAGFGFFIFGVPNALFLGLIAILAGVLPIIGTPLVWLPVAIYLFIAENSFAAWGVIVFGILSSTIDNFLRPLIVSKRTKIHSGILLISMIGGLFFFGVLGLILGPLIISYLLVLLEAWRGRSIPGIMLESEKTSKV